MQRPDGVAALALFVGSLGLTQGMLAIEERPGLDLPVDLVDAREAGLHQLRRGDTPLTDAGGRFDQRKRAQAHLRSSTACSPHRGV